LASSLKEEANKAFKAKDFTKAKELYQKALNYLDFNESEEAVKLLRGVRLNLSLMYCREKNYDEAIEQATKVLEKDENDVKALFRRATASFKKKDLNSAKNDCKKAYNLDSKNKPLISLFKKV